MRKRGTVLPYRRSLSRDKLLRRAAGKQRAPLNKCAKKSKKATPRKKQRLSRFKKRGSICLKRRSARRKRLRTFGRLPLWRPSADYDLSNRAIVQHALESLLEKNRKLKKLFRRRLNVRRLPLAVRAYRFKRAQRPITKRAIYCPAAQFTNSLIASRQRLFVRMFQRRGRWRRRKKLRRLLRRRRPTVTHLVPVHTSRLLPSIVLLSSRAHLADMRLPYRPSVPLFSTKTSEPATAYLSTELKQLFTVIGPNLQQRRLHLRREILVDRAQTSAARLHQEYQRHLRKKNYVQVRTEANKDRRARIARVKKVKIKLRQVTQGSEMCRRFATKRPEAKKVCVARQAAERFRSR